MYKKNTDELQNVLNKVHPDDIDEYFKKETDEMMSGDRDFMEYMNQKFKEKNLKKQDVLLKADIALKYGYKLLEEEKKTQQRDTILRICYAAEFTLDESQRALRLYGMATLYARDRRDALIITLFNERPGDIIRFNEILLSHKVTPLRSSGTQE